MKLKDCCTIIAGQSPESKYYNEIGDGLPFFQGKADFGEIYPTIRIYCSQPVKIAEKDDILLSVRAPVGPTNLSPGRVCIGRGLCAIRPNPEILNVNYVLTFFKYFEIQLAQKGTGTTFNSITQNLIRNLEIPVPNLAEQEKIVIRIDELFSELDNAQEVLQATKLQLEVYRQAVLEEAFKGNLIGKSIGAQKHPLGKLIEKPRYGTSKKCSYTFENTRTPVYRIPNINYRDGCIDHEDIKYAALSENEKQNLKLKTGDILIIRSNGSVSLVGRAAIVGDEDLDGAFAGYLMRLRIKDPSILSPQFLLRFLQSHTARIYIESKAKSTSGVNNINSDEIREIPIPMYSVSDQNKIINEIESRLSVCDNIDNIIYLAMQQEEALRHSILKQAFEGGLK